MLRCKICGEHRHGNLVVPRSGPRMILTNLFPDIGDSGALFVHVRCLEQLGLDRRPDPVWWVRNLQQERGRYPLLAAVDDRIREILVAELGSWTPTTIGVAALCAKAARMVSEEFAFIFPVNPLLCARTLDLFSRFRVSAFHAPPMA